VTASGPSKPLRVWSIDPVAVISFRRNQYEEARELMNAIARKLHSKGLTTKLVQAQTNEITPNITLPDVLTKHLFTGKSGLIARKHVKYHHMVLEIAR